MTTREDCVTLDAGDPLAYLREEFLLPAGTLRFDSDRLGPLTRGVRARLDGFLRVDWGTDFTNGPHLAEATAEKLAPLLGAQAGSLGFAATADDAIEALADAACASGRKRVLALPGEFAALPARLGAKGLTVTETEAPEAQLDRFMLELPVHYPSREEEEEIATLTTAGPLPEVRKVSTAGEMVELQGLVRRVPAPPSLIRFAVKLARATRPGNDAAKVCSRYVSWGAGPRASQYLVLGAKARAASRGSAIPSFDDVRYVAPAVLAHRLILNFEAEAARRRTRDVIAELLEESRDWR